MKQKVKRVVFAILTILTFISIFFFSSQNGEKSGATSRGFTRKIIEILQIDKNMEEEQKELIIENCQYVVRKLAHFTIYTILGINLMGFFDTFNIKDKNKLTLIILVGFIYAISDELHQMLSGGRTPAIKDVVIDTLGVIFGIGIFKILRVMLNSEKKMEKIS